jgi:hypothetical protein
MCPRAGLDATYSYRESKEKKYREEKWEEESAGRRRREEEVHKGEGDKISIPSCCLLTWGFICKRLTNETRPTVTRNCRSQPTECEPSNYSQVQFEQDFWLKLYRFLLVFGSGRFESLSKNCLTAWPLSLRHEQSSSARTLGSWVWIPLNGVYSVCVVLCVSSSLATGWLPVHGDLQSV